MVSDIRLLRFDVERLPDFTGIIRQRLFAAAPRVALISITGDRRYGAVAIVVAESVERNAMAARYGLWDVGASGAACVDAAADSASFE